MYDECARTRARVCMCARVCSRAVHACVYVYTKVVEHACGRAPNLEDAELVARLQRARRVRVRMQARAEFKWNLAMDGLAEEAESAKGDGERAELIQELAELLTAAGFGDDALSVLLRHPNAAQLEDLSLQDVPKLQWLLQKADILARLGRAEQIEMIGCHLSEMEPRSGRDANVQEQVVEMLRRAQNSASGEQPRIQEYALWRLHSITHVSKHSAVYHFRSDDQLRGTPIRRGRGGRTVWSKTWHTTLLARVGKVPPRGQAHGLVVTRCNPDN